MADQRSAVRISLRLENFCNPLTTSFDLSWETNQQYSISQVLNWWEEQSRHFEESITASPLWVIPTTFLIKTTQSVQDE
jgi:hypothetical protein